MIRIGTSGWAQQGLRELSRIPAAHRLAPGDLLRAYSQQFAAVEINSTFHRWHRRSTFTNWRGLVPRQFRFAIKASRLFTHDRDLVGGRELPQFLEDISALGSNLGAVLFQLPAGFHADPLLLRRFVTRLRHLAPGTRYTFELRHPSWHSAATYRVLERAGMAFCIFDIRQFSPPPVLTADFTYVRLHGPLKEPYRGPYEPEAIEAWAERLRGWEKARIDSYLFFDNTMYGHALGDALSLKACISSSDRGVAALCPERHSLRTRPQPKQ